jgi:hypothetical protein
MVKKIFLGNYNMMVRVPQTKKNIKNGLDGVWGQIFVGIDEY